MEILITKSREELEEKTTSYVRYFDPLVQEFSEGVARIPELQNEWVFVYNTATMRWPIRKLEYSYVIERALGQHGKNLKALDVGCGVTPFALLLKRILRANVVAVDCDHQLVRLMNQYQKTIFNDEIQYCLGDISELPFEDDTFDFASCISVIEHLNEGTDLDVIKELLRVVKKGGSLTLTIDFTAGYRHRFNLWLYRLRKLFEYVRLGEWAYVLGRTRRIINNVQATPDCVGPYTKSKLRDEFLSGFGLNVPDAQKNLDGVSLEDIHVFWADNWFPGCEYSRNGRDYVSLGIELIK